MQTKQQIKTFKTNWQRATNDKLTISQLEGIGHAEKEDWMADHLYTAELPRSVCSKRSGQFERVLRPVQGV